MCSFLSPVAAPNRICKVTCWICLWAGTVWSAFVVGSTLFYSLQRCFLLTPHLHTHNYGTVMENILEDLIEEMATHSSTLAWKIPWTEEPGRLRSMGSQRVGHDWATSLLSRVKLWKATHHWCPRFFAPQGSVFTLLGVRCLLALLPAPTLPWESATPRREQVQSTQSTQSLPQSVHHRCSFLHLVVRSRISLWLHCFYF